MKPVESGRPYFFCRNPYLVNCFALIAKAQVKGIMKTDCHPIGLAVVVANDNRTVPRTLNAASSSRSLIIDTESVGHAGGNTPEFDAIKSCSTLKSELESCGVMVVPISNRSKSYLAAVLKVLAHANIPKSCELFWFIFSGHGQQSCICMNGQQMEFDTIIQLASKVKTAYFAFFFECCQVNGGLIKASKIEQQHMTIYSSPPNAVAYYYQGLGLMVICLTEMLREGYKDSLNALQHELRQRIVNKMQDVLNMPAARKKAFLNHHLPVHTSSMFSDINLYEKTYNISE